MEAEFLNLIEEEDRESFILYSKSVGELAGFFKVQRDPKIVM